MRASDKLIRQKCPACDAAITLSSSTLNKKIHCPKCRQLVIIPSEAAPEEEKPAVVEIAFQRNEAPEVDETPLPAMNRFPAEKKPIAFEEMHDPVKKPVVYCLCNGVLKRRTLSKEGPSKNVCCMCNDEAATSL